MIHFRRNCAQEWQSNSATHSGSGARGKIPAAEWTIHYDSHPAIPGEREDLFFGFALEQ